MVIPPRRKKIRRGPLHSPDIPKGVLKGQGYSSKYTKRGYSSNLPQANRLKRLGKSKSRYGKVYGQYPYGGVGFRGKTMQVTDAKIRRKQYPKFAKKKRVSLGTDVFTVGGYAKKDVLRVRTFEYLPHLPAQRQLGHPVALGDDIIVSIHFKPDKSLIYLAETLFKNQGKKWKGSFEDHLKRQVRWVSAYFFKKAIEQEIRPRIHKLVPYASGRLQKGMVATVNRCVREINTLPHILKLNTLDNLSNPVYYANPVNNMPTEWLAHPPNEPLTRIYYHKSGPKRYDLYDPTAETDWYSKVIDSAQKWIRANQGLLYKAIVGLFGLNMVSMAIYSNLKKNMKFK